MSTDMQPLPASVRALLDRATAGPPPSRATRAQLKARIDDTVAATGTGITAGLATGVLGKLVLAGAVVAAAGVIAKHELAPTASAPPQLEVAATLDADPDIATAARARLPALAKPSLAKPPPIEAAHTPARERQLSDSPPATGVPAPNEANVESPPAERNVDHARERALLERARRAVAARNGGDAIALLDTHAAEFTDGKLGEEREALMVRALALVGNSLAAAARARAFRARYPSSIFLDQVDAAAPDSNVKDSP